MDFCGFIADSMRWAKIYYNNRRFIYRLPAGDNKVYLTFDDGPTPGLTEWILKTLNEFDAKATFFMIGKNIAKHPYLVEMILEQGHSIGNHTYNHLRGFSVDTEQYINDVVRTQKLLPSGSKLFRPPYGRIKIPQAKKIMDLGLNIILWTVISCDYEQRISGQRVYNLVRRRIRPGSIIVFHDSLKAEKNMKFALRKILEQYSGAYEFARIDL